MRCLIVSDIHGNLEAFDAVLQTASGYDQVWCLGDIVGYGPAPHECIQRLRSLPFVAVAGNHDWAMVNRVDLNDFNADAQEAAHWTHDQLLPDDHEFLAHLPERVVLDGFTLVHGSPRHPVWEYILQPSIARASFAHFDTPVCLVGHTHVPIIYALTESREATRCRTQTPSQDTPLSLAGAPRMIINPGSVGQPRDGNPLAAYAMLDTEAQTLSFHRLDYAVEETQRKMGEYNLPPRLIARLTFGW
jgi:predicted phosphodiesterase